MKIIFTYLVNYYLVDKIKPTNGVGSMNYNIFIDKTLVLASCRTLSFLFCNPEYLYLVADGR